MSKSFYLSILYGAFHSSRMLIGAIHVLYLLSTGVKLPQLAVLQIVFFVTISLAEFPTGIVADTSSRKLSVLIACGLVSVFFLLCLFSPDMRFLTASQIFYALGLCFTSGALEAWITETIEIEYPHDKLKINYFGYLRGEFAAIGNMITGFLGALFVLLLPNGFPSVYILSAIIMLILLVLFSRVPYHLQKTTLPKASEYYQTLSLSLRTCFRSRDGLFFLVLVGLGVAIYQPVYHYWQPFFLALAKADYRLPIFLKKDVILLGVVFFVYNLMKYLLNLYARNSLLKRYDQFSIGVLAALGSTIFMIILSLASQRSIYFYIILFGLFHGTGSVVGAITESQYLKIAPAKQMASILSAASAFARIVGIAMLFLIASFVNEANLSRFFLISGLLFFIYAAVFQWWKSNYAIEKVWIKENTI